MYTMACLFLVFLFACSNVYRDLKVFVKEIICIHFAYKIEWGKKKFTGTVIFNEVIGFSSSKNGKVQKRGKINLVGRLQLSTEKSKEEDNEGIMQLRILRVQVGHSFSSVSFK